MYHLKCLPRWRAAICSLCLLLMSCNTMRKDVVEEQSGIGGLADEDRHKYIGKVVVVTGRAENCKSCALLIAANTWFKLPEIAEWPLELEGKAVVVRGVLCKSPLIRIQNNVGQNDSPGGVRLPYYYIIAPTIVSPLLRN